MRVAAAALEDFLERLFRAAGVAAVPASATARNMVWCELAGRGNYGLNRVPVHLKRLKHGVLDGQGRLKIEKRGASVVMIDGAGGFGQHIAEVAMAEAIALARETGVGVAGVAHSNSFGAGAYYLNQAAEAGMIALIAANSFPKVVPHGGLKAVFGTNPFAFGAPRGNGEHVLIDFATSALSGSAVTAALAKGEALPDGVAIDADGNAVTDPRRMSTVALLPFGGARGYGLSLMVEILAGVLMGGGMTAGVASIFNDFSRNGGNGHFMLALDIERFIPRALFDARLEALVGEVEASGSGVRLPGAARWRDMAERRAHGIPLPPEIWTPVAQDAAALGVALPELLAA